MVTRTRPYVHFNSYDGEFGLGNKTSYYKFTTVCFPRRSLVRPWRVINTTSEK